MTLESSKGLGGVGSILLIVSAVAFLVEPLLAMVGLIGIVLILVSLHGLADYYKEKGIFINALSGFIAVIVGGIVTVGGFVYLFFLTSFGKNFVSLFYPGFNGDWTTIPNLTLNTNVNPNDLVPYVGSILLVLAIMWVFCIVAGFFTWQSFKIISSRAKVNLFSVGGLLLLIGAFLAIVFIGLVLMWIAVLLISIAFFQIKPQPEPAATAPYPSKTITV